MTLHRPVVALLAALAVLAAACAKEADDPVALEETTTSQTDGTSTTTEGEGPNGFTPDPIEWDDCGAVECATLEVPLDYSEPDGERIKIYVVRTPASGERTT